MRLIVPNLFPPARLREPALAGLRVPAMETLYARGRFQAGKAGGLEKALAGLFGFSDQQGIPLAPHLLKGAGIEPGDAWWLRVEPVHLQVRRDTLVPIMGPTLALQDTEAEALRTSLAQHFGSDLSILATPEGDWYLQRTAPLGFRPPPPSLSAGQTVALPQGSAALEWQTLLNEIQMLLHDHPVNQAREAAGHPAINSVWVWGAGRWTEPRATVSGIYADYPVARQLARGLDVECFAVPAQWDPQLPQSAIVVLDALLEPGQYNDAWVWRTALQDLERGWLAPLLQARRSFSLEDSQSGRTLHWHPLMNLRVWRRPMPLSRPSVLPEPLSTASTHGEFGDQP